MDIEALAALESQKKFCSSLVNKVVGHESFILFSGERGSGRTVVCEQVVNETDSKMRAVFIPCNKDMQLQRLRELFLQQLLPGVAFDTNLNLADALLKVHIQHKDRILVVVDDIDTVVSSFYNELLALYEQFLGQDRFAFILVGKPLWAEEKVAHHQSKFEIEQMQIPALSLEESIILARHIFALNSALKIFSTIEKKLPEQLKLARGNLGKVINISETIMKLPSGQKATSASAKGGLFNNQGKGKSGNSVTIFITAVCVVIVLACLIPIFFGGNFFSSDDDASTNMPTNTQAQVANDEALVFNGGNREFNTNRLNNDDGLLPQNVPNGIDAQTPEMQTEHSVTLSGDELDKIEGGANHSGYPRGVDRSINQVVTLRRGDNFNHVNANAASQTTQIAAPTVQNTQLDVAKNQAVEAPKSNASAAQIAADTAALARAAREKLEADRRQAQAAQAKANQVANTVEAKANTATASTASTSSAANTAPKATEVKTAESAPTVSRQPLRAGQVINLAEEQRQLAAAKQNANRGSAVANTNAKAVEGSMSELSAIANGRYTVQIVSASNRNNIKAAANHLNSRYWIVESSRNGRPWYILVAGDYASREEAIAAAANIPRAASQGAKPFAKRFGDVKSEIRH